MRERSEREQRLSAALRENLKRRKAQARERTPEKASGGEDSTPAPDSADTGSDGDD